MKKIRILRIVFTPEIRPYEIPAFRGAIVEKVGRDSILFHNHVGDNYLQNYPRIQYKRLYKKATIVCIEQGVDEIYKLFNQPNWSLNLNGNEYEMKIEKLSVNSYNMNVWDKFFRYRIKTWLALNEKNLEIYNEINSITEKIKFLERILTANILSFAKGIDWFIEDKKIEVKIDKIINEGTTKFKKIPRKFFDLEFRTNVFLPNYIGLGKAASHGFGIVSTVRKNKLETN